MPELPEVETIRRQLENEMLGEEFAEITVLDRKVFAGDETRLLGQKISKLGRSGKYLFVYFASGRGIAIHLKMTGRMIMGNAEIYESAKHTRIKVVMKSGRRVYYWDTRRFGYWRVEDDIKASEESTKARLGPDPWEMTAVKWLGICKRSNRPIKTVILDQGILAGVGNIYANDGLWKAELDPRRPAKSLSKKEAIRLLASLRAVMERGLVTGGASDNSYVDAMGEKGSYQDEFLVYRRVGQPCLRDGTPLKRIVIGGRGTWVCEKCQK